MLLYDINNIVIKTKVTSAGFVVDDAANYLYYRVDITNHVDPTNEITGEIEISLDGGVTWLPSTNFTIPGGPPPVGPGGQSDPIISIGTSLPAGTGRQVRTTASALSNVRIGVEVHDDR